MLGAGLLVGPDAFSQGWSGNVVQGFLLLQIGGGSGGGAAAGDQPQHREPEKTMQQAHKNLI